MIYKILGDMGLWEQVNLKNDIKGTLLDYELKRGSVIVWQIYDCFYISCDIRDKYSHLKFEELSDKSRAEEIAAIDDLLGLQVKFEI